VVHVTVHLCFILALNLKKLDFDFYGSLWWTSSNIDNWSVIGKEIEVSSQNWDLVSQSGNCSCPTNWIVQPKAVSNRRGCQLCSSIMQITAVKYIPIYSNIF
jgi:hypothetical protein